MSPMHWAVSIVGFPLGGLAANSLFSTTDGPLAAALAGLVAGTILGAAQWLALRGAVSVRWIAATALGLAAGAALGVAITDGATTLGALALFGTFTGACVGAAQGLVLGMRHLAAWATTVAASWTLAWVITAAVIVDEQKGFVLFGLSGAALATLATGVALRMMLGPRRVSARAEAVAA